MRLALGAAAACTTAAIVMTVSALGYTSAGAAQTTVTVDDFFFCDASFEGGVCNTDVAVGDAVVWTVAGGFHTVTQCDETYTTCPIGGGFDSGQLTQGDTFQHTFSSQGTFYYICMFHPQQMRGTVTVTAVQATPSPTPGTETPTPTASLAPAPASATPTPAGVPATGGAHSSGVPTAALVPMAIGGIVALGATTLALRSALVSRRP